MELKEELFLLSDILVNISIECFMHAHASVRFFSALYRPTVFEQSFSLLYLFKFFVVRHVCDLVVSFSFTLLACIKHEKNQIELQCVGNFRRLSAENAGGPLDGIFLSSESSAVPKST